MHSIYRRKNAAASTAGAKIVSPEEGALGQPEYKKLYKQLGMNTGCKDVRNLLKDRLDGELEANMSPNLQLNMNPGYQLDNGMHRTIAREDFKGEKT